METLQTIQQLAPATIIAAVATLPWIAATLMQAFSATSSSAHDDKWRLRAGAAVRWADTLGGPVQAGGNAVVKLAARRATRSISTKVVRGAEFFPHAA